MNIFDILGPIMVGPSSSHTAGAVRIGLAARAILSDEVKKAEIYLHGSFADTGVGHGTDRAIVGGLMGMQPDDERISYSFAVANKAGMEFSFEKNNMRNSHPNTALIKLYGKNGNIASVKAASVGGGRIMITEINGMDVEFSCEYPTLIAESNDKPGFAAHTAAFLTERNVNIATINLFRDKRGGNAVMVMEIDSRLSKDVIDEFKNIDFINKVAYVEL